LPIQSLRAPVDVRFAPAKTHGVANALSREGLPGFVAPASGAAERRAPWLSRKWRTPGDQAFACCNAFGTHERRFAERDANAVADRNDASAREAGAPTVDARQCRGESGACR